MFLTVIGAITNLHNDDDDDDGGEDERLHDLYVGKL